MQNLIVKKSNENELVVSTLDVAEQTQNEHASVMKLVRTYLNDFETFGGVGFEIEPFETAGGNQSREIALLNENQSALLLTYMRNSEIVRSFKVRLIKEFSDMKNQKPKTQLELAREQVALLERLEQIEIERDLAIATKAEIGNRREATAMNTASQAVKKANALEIELDRSKDYATVKRMEMLHHGVKFDWRKLKATCVDMVIEPLSVFDQNYGTVKAYHRDVWQETYALTF